MDVASPHTRVHVPTLAAGVALGVWLVGQLPAVLCMGLDCDIQFYDLVARRVLAGDTHYRDLIDTNLPGFVWVHMAVRSVFGWGSVALRAVDLALVGGIVGLLVGWLPRGVSAVGRIGSAAALLAFYFSTSEWCHCQRDVWMMLPCLVALALRVRQVSRLAGSEGSARVFAWAFVEGTVWAAAFWIKPFVAVPGLACWLISAWFVWNQRRLAVDLAGFLAGGLLIGSLGTTWLIGTGAWPSFLTVMFDWNREYFAFDSVGGSWWAGSLGLGKRFFPWILVHFAAVPIAVYALMKCSTIVSALRAGFYLGWLLQSFALQHPFDYVHAPAILLGIAILAGETAARSGKPSGWLLVLFLIFCVAWKGIGLSLDRAKVWSACVSAGSTPAVRDRVGLLHRVDHQDLNRVAEYLRGLNLRDDELTCFALTTVGLYDELNLRPPTRYLLLQENLQMFASRKETILSAVADSRQKYLVCDVWRVDMNGIRERLDRDPHSSRAIFRVGNYVVFRLDGSEVREWFESVR